MKKNTLTNIEKSKLKRRGEILRAAERLFSINGYYKTAIDEIAGSLSIAKGTIYLYFKSKKEILISLFQERLTELYGLLSEASRAPSENRLQAIIETEVDFFCRRKEFVRLLVAEHSRSFSNERDFISIVLEHLSKRIALLAKTLEPLVENKSIAKGNLEWLVLAMEGMIGRLLAENLFLNKKFNKSERNKVINSLRDLFLYGIKGKEQQ